MTSGSRSRGLAMSATLFSAPECSGLPSLQRTRTAALHQLLPKKTAWIGSVCGVPRINTRTQRSVDRFFHYKISMPASSTSGRVAPRAAGRASQHPFPRPPPHNSHPRIRGADLGLGRRTDSDSHAEQHFPALLGVSFPRWIPAQPRVAVRAAVASSSSLSASFQLSSPFCGQVTGLPATVGSDIDSGLFARFAMPVFLTLLLVVQLVLPGEAWAEWFGGSIRTMYAYAATHSRVPVHFQNQHACSTPYESCGEAGPNPASQSELNTDKQPLRSLWHSASFCRTLLLRPPVAVSAGLQRKTPGLGRVRRTDVR